jgi:hypothetical protein
MADHVGEKNYDSNADEKEHTYSRTRLEGPLVSGHRQYGYDPRLQRISAWTGLPPRDWANEVCALSNEAELKPGQLRFHDIPMKTATSGEDSQSCSLSTGGKCGDHDVLPHGNQPRHYESQDDQWSHGMRASNTAFSCEGPINDARAVRHVATAE